MTKRQTNKFKYVNTVNPTHFLNPADSIDPLTHKVRCPK